MPWTPQATSGSLMCPLYGGQCKKNCVLATFHPTNPEDWTCEFKAKINRATRPAGHSSATSEAAEATKRR